VHCNRQSLPLTKLGVNDFMLRVLFICVFHAWPARGHRLECVEEVCQDRSALLQGKVAVSRQRDGMEIAHRSSHGSLIHSARSEAAEMLKKAMSVEESAALTSVNVTEGKLIPDQLIMTGKQGTYEEMPNEVRTNILKMLSLENEARKPKGQSPMHLRWFGDDSCRQYLKDHFDEELSKIFDEAAPGYYRADICRTAVLAREGGFYLDVDVELNQPITNLVDEKTTFMSAYSMHGDILNALLAAVPESPVMLKALDEMRNWYKNNENTNASHGLMGTQCTYRGLHQLTKDDCPDVNLKAMRSKLQWHCGKNAIRLYEEKEMLCWSLTSEECSIEREEASSWFHRLGLFVPDSGVKGHRTLVGWPRFLCQDPGEGCGAGGHAAWHDAFMREHGF